MLLMEAFISLKLEHFNRLTKFIVVWSMTEAIVQRNFKAKNCHFHSVDQETRF